VEEEADLANDVIQKFICFFEQFCQKRDEFVSLHDCQYIGEGVEGGTHNLFVEEVGSPLFERINRPDNRSGLRRIRRGTIRLDVVFNGLY
jgi:hypothetical protein